MLRYRYSSVVDWQTLWWYLLYSICAVIFIFFIMAAIFEDQYKQFLETYVGREYIYKRDTVAIIFVDEYKKKFILTNGSIVAPEVIYKLKEVKY